MPRRLRAPTMAAGALALCIAVFCGWLFHRSSSPARSLTDPTVRAAALDRSMRAIEDSEAEAPRDRWDPDYVVDKLGRDPQRLFAWVRDKTFWIPYHGVLRGAVGVLMDRQGNSLDRALLLATLLEKAGQSVRLAHGEMTHDQAIDLLPSLSSARTSALAESSAANVPAAPAAEFEAAATQYQLDGAALGTAFAAQAQALEVLSTELRSRGADEAQRLLGAVADPQPAIGWGRNFDASVAALRDHWWVQWQKSSGTWTDLDVLQTGRRQTAPPVTATDTLDLKALADAPVHQEIALRVIAERWSRQGLNQHVALERVLRPAELIGQPIVLQFWPTQWFADSTLGSAPRPAEPKREWRAELLDLHEWGAGLTIGGDVVAVATLPESGEAGDAPTKQDRGGPMGGFAAAFSDTMNGRNHAAVEQRADTTLSAVWFEYEIRIPGAPPRTIRRTVFDLLGPAARAAAVQPPLALDDGKKLTRTLALTMQTELLPLNCRLAPEFLVHLLARSVLESRDLLTRALGGKLTQTGAAVDDSSADAGQPLSSLYALAMGRLQWSAQSSQVFINQPNLLTSHHYFSPQGSGLVMRHATDIVANEIGVDLQADSPFAVRVAQGVLDTNAESLARPDEVTFGNAGEAYAARRDWVTVASGKDAASLHGIGLPDDTRQMIMADLSAGYATVAPPAAVPMPKEPFAGWWRIDPVSGDTLGFGANGWGAELAENNYQNNQASLMVRYFRGFPKRFMYTFGSAYGWCLAPLMANGVETQGLHLGTLRAALVSSVNECAGDALFIGIVGSVTMPLIALTYEATGASKAIGASPKGPALPEPPISANAKTYNGIAPSEPCNPAGPEPTAPTGSEPPGGPGGTGPEWPATESPTEGANGRGPYKPAYLEVRVNEASTGQAQAVQAYNQAVNVADAAEIAFRQADAAFDQAQAALDQAIANETAGRANYSFDELQALGAQKKAAEVRRFDAQMKNAAASTAKRADLSDLQSANKAADYWPEMQLANQRRIQASNALDAANQKFWADSCRPGGQLPATGSAQYNEWASAVKEYNDALSNWNKVKFGAQSAPGPADPMGATQPAPPDPNGATQLPTLGQANPASLDKTVTGQSGNTLPLQGAPGGGSALPDPLAPSPAAKTVAGIVSAGNVLRGK
jgi:hypothetical protein